MGKNIWSEDDTSERLMNLAVFKVPFTGKEMGCAVLLAVPLLPIIAIAARLV